jgi:hypothetical protein
MFEHHKQPLLSRPAFLRRLARHGVMALTMILGSLLVGVLGYRFIGGLGWVDAIENAAMILGGMGPVAELHSTAAKLFAAAYAMFAGIVFLVGIGVLLVPFIHRFVHRFHLEGEPGDRRRR